MTLAAALRSLFATLALGCGAVLVAPQIDVRVVVLAAVAAGVALAALMARARPVGPERAVRLALQLSSLAAALCVVMPKVASLPPSSSPLSTSRAVVLMSATALPGAGGWPILVVAASLILGGAVVVAVALRALLAGGGTADPFDPPLTLCTTGPYARMRHPMQAGQIAVVGGAALLEGTAGAAVASLVFALLLVGPVRFLEEEQLEDRFGDAFRRWRRREQGPR